LEHAVDAVSKRNRTTRNSRRPDQDIAIGDRPSGREVINVSKIAIRPVPAYQVKIWVVRGCRNFQLIARNAELRNRGKQSDLDLVTAL
jgi:hypothetical protein